MAPVGREIKAAVLPFDESAVELAFKRHLAGLFQGKDDAGRVRFYLRPKEGARKQKQDQEKDRDSSHSSPRRAIIISF